MRIAVRILSKRATAPAANCHRSFITRPAKQPIQVAIKPNHDSHPSYYGKTGLRIQRTLKHLGHKHWGFIIYRCTYGDDAARSRFMDILQSSIRETLEFEGVRGLTDTLDMSVQEDAAVLLNASKELERQRFRQGLPALRLQVSGREQVRSSFS